MKENKLQIDTYMRNLGDDIEKARRISWMNLGKRIIFYVPSFIYYRSRYINQSRVAFPSISITGYACSLNCKHCGGRLLKTMIPAKSPERLIEVCSEIKRRGGIGCLISGGSMADGHVPLERFIEAIAKIKRSLNLTIVVHTGLINSETAMKLREAGIDAALIDIIGSNDTIREIYRLNATTREFEDSLKALRDAGIPLVPHVLVGLHYGKIKGEIEALRMIAKYSPSALIIIAFFPIKKTPMEDVKPPSPEDIVRVIIKARDLMPKIPMALGCARPKGEHRSITDVLAVRAGINAIAFPADEAVREARNLGLEIKTSPLCCSQVFSEIKPIIGQIF